MNDHAKTDPNLVLGQKDLDEIARHAVPKQFKARTVLVSEGEKTDTLYIIVEGRVRAYVSDADGREAVLSVMGPGEYFGEIAFDAGPRSASVMTLEPCRLLIVQREGRAVRPGKAHAGRHREPRRLLARDGEPHLQGPHPGPLHQRRTRQD